MYDITRWVQGLGGTGEAGHGWPHSCAASLFCLLFTLHSRETYNSLAAWLTDARTLASPNIVVILCGNKKDLDPEREVTFLEASRFAQENGEGCAADQVMGEGMGLCTVAHELLSFRWMIVPSAWRLQQACFRSHVTAVVFRFS